MPPSAQDTDNKISFLQPLFFICHLGQRYEATLTLKMLITLNSLKLRWTLKFPKWNWKTKGKTLSSCVSMKIYSGLIAHLEPLGIKCQRCISWHPQRTMFTKSFDSYRDSLCVHSFCQMAKYSLTLLANPLLSPPSSKLSPHIREESCNYCTSVTVETTSQQSRFGHRWADG